MAYTVKEMFYTLQGEGAQAGRAAVFCRFAGCNLWSGHEADRPTAICRFCDTDFVGSDGAGGGRFEAANDLARAAASCRSGGRLYGRDAGTVKTKISADRAEGRESSEPSPRVGTDARDAAEGSGGAHASHGVHAIGGAAGSCEADAGVGLIVLTGGEPLLQVDATLVDALHGVGFEIAVETNGTLVVPAGVDWICVSPKAGAPLVQRSGDELKCVYPQTGIDPAEFEQLDFRHFFLQPMASPDRKPHAADSATQAALRYCLEHPRWRLSLQLHKILGIP